MKSGPPADPKSLVTRDFRLIPIHPDAGPSPLNVSVLVRKNPDAAAGHFVTVRELRDGRVHLGCVSDAGGEILEWVEIWIQNIDGIQSAPPAFRSTLSNHLLDRQWEERARVFRRISPRKPVITGWESKHPAPTFLDLDEGRMTVPADPETGEPLALCRDDAQLAAAGLPPYTVSCARYLKAPNGSTFYAVTSGAAASDRVRPVNTLTQGKNAVPFNLEGGLLLIRPFAPFSLEDYADLLAGRKWNAAPIGKALPMAAFYPSLQDWDRARCTSAFLFLGDRGRPGRFLEIFHLKLQLLLDAISSVAGAIQEQQLPLLNLSGESFRVSLQEVGTGLPFLWTARCDLVKPGDAAALPVQTTTHRYFLKASPAVSVYFPERAGIMHQGTGSVRVRKVFPPTEEGFSLEGTLVTGDNHPISPNDLLWIRIPVQEQRLDLYAHVAAGESLAYGEARFRTLGQKIPEPVASSLPGLEGVSFAHCPYEVVPLLSSPADLYSLGVLAARLLISSEKNSLPVVVDELLSLARQASAGFDPGTTLVHRLQALFEKDTRWKESLGPQFLFREEMEPEAAARLLPPELWFETLGFVLKLFPGAAPGSFCKDYGDVHDLALETVFGPVLESLQLLLIKTRSLILIDWNANREIQSVLRKFSTE